MDSSVEVRSPILSTPLSLDLTALDFAVIWQRPYPMKISLKVSERDKHKMYETYQATLHNQDQDTGTCWDDTPLSENLPPLKHSETDTDGWEDFDVPVLYFYGGLLPYVGRCVFSSASTGCSRSWSSPYSRDLLQWPLALPKEGLIDVAVQETASVSSLLRLIGSAPQGGSYWSDKVSERILVPTDLPVPLFPPTLPLTFPSQQHFFKVHAYRVKTPEGGILSIDGEDTQCSDFQVEVHKGMGAFLSPSGRFGVHFNYPAPVASTK